MPDPQTIDDRYRECRPQYEKFTRKLSDFIRHLMRQNNIPVHAIESRTKELESVKKKLARTNSRYQRLEDLCDLSGVRVIVYRLKDVERVGAVVESEFVVDRSQTEDKSRELGPQEFGYRSVHYGISPNREQSQQMGCESFGSLEAELQIRTVLQHAWAEISRGALYRSDQADARRRRRLSCAATKRCLSIPGLDAGTGSDGQLALEARPAPFMNPQQHRACSASPR